jgi:hypothetical protein
VDRLNSPAFDVGYLRRIASRMWNKDNSLL